MINLDIQRTIQNNQTDRPSVRLLWQFSLTQSRSVSRSFRFVPLHGIRRVISRASEISERAALPGPAKVPRLTLYFWVIKILTTALGEATSDYLVHNVNPYLAVFGGFLTFLAAMAIQFRVRTYLPWAYWLAVTMVAVFGTMAADVLHVEFGVPYIASTVFFAITLAVVFVTWYRSEGTLSIKSVYAGRREVFYWAAVLATFAMGTAAGDLAAYTAGLGFLTAGLFFAALFAAPGGRVPVLRPERDLRLLVRLHPDASAGSLARRLAGQVPDGGRPGLR